MKHFSKSARAVALALALLTAISLAACKGEAAPEKVKLTNVFKSETIPTDEKLQGIDRITVAGETVYYMGYYSYQDGEEYKYSNALYSMNLDGSGVKMLMEMEDQSDYEKQIYRSSYIQSMVAGNDGSLWVVMQEYYNDYSDPDYPIYENKTSIKKIDSGGNVLAEIDSKTMQPDSEYFYINSLAFDNSGNAYVASDMTIYVLDSTSASLLFTIQSDSYLGTCVRSGSGDVYVLSWGEKGQEFYKIDFNRRALGDKIELGYQGMNSIMPGSGEYDFYYQDGSYTSLMGYKLATGEAVEIVNWINSNTDGSRLNNITTLSDGRIMGSEYSEDYSKMSLMLFTRIPDAEVKEVIPLTFATMYMNSDIRTAIIRYNRSQDEYHINVIDYSKYAQQDWYAGYDKLNMDIIGGNIPDIINLEQLNVNNFINKGLLADLYPLIDADPEISREDLLTNVLDACSQNGKLYRLMPMFYIYTVAGKTSVVGGTPGWTMDDLNALMARMPEGTVAFAEMTKSSILYYSTMMAMDQFINQSTGECSFDSDAFVQLLEFVNGFETEIDWEAIYGEDNWWEKRNDAYKDDRTLLMMSNVYNMRSIREAKERFGAPVTYIGFPTANKNGSCISPIMDMAISAKSKHKDAAWQFLRSFLLEDRYLGDNVSYFWGLTLNKNVMEQLLANEKVPYFDRPENQGQSSGIIAKPMGSAVVSRSVVSTYPGNSEWDAEAYYKDYHLTDEEGDQIMALITSVNQLMYSDTKVNEIITTEVEIYFSGDRDARATADIIQNKIQTYINESR